MVRDDDVSRSLDDSAADSWRALTICALYGTLKDSNIPFVSRLEVVEPPATSIIVMLKPAVEKRMSKKAFIHIALLISLVPFARGQGTPASASQPPNDKASELFHSALLNVQTRNWELPRRQMQEAVRVWIQIRQPEKAARALLQLGHSYRREPNYQACLYFYKQVFQVRALSGAIRSEAYIAIARVYAELSNNNLAIDYFNKAVEQARRVGDRPVESLALSGLADVHRLNGDKKAALAVIAQARRLSGQTEAGEAGLLQTAGQLYQQERRLEQARGAFDQALAIYRRTAEVEGQVKILCSIVDLSLLASQKTDAMAQSEQALELANQQAKAAKTNADKTRARDLLWRAWLGRARAERANGRMDLASKSFQFAFSHAEASWWLVKISTETSAIAFGQETQAIHREYVDLLMHQGRVSEAFSYADRAKGQAIRGIIQGRRNKISTGPSDSTESPHKLNRSIARMRTQLLYSKTGIEREKLEKGIADAESALEEERLRTEVESSRDRLVWTKPATVKLLQEMMARDKSALLEFLLGETRSFAWIITADSVSCAVLPSRKEIEQAVRPYLTSLATAPNPLRLETEIAKSRAQSESLSSILFGKLIGRIAPGQKLIVVPDGLLHYLPFETLIHDQRYLVESHEIIYNPSASMLGLWQDSPKQANNGKKMDLLAFGDPHFGVPNASIGKKRVGEVSNLPQRTRSAQRNILPPLPRTRDEVEHIGNLFPADRRRVYLGNESTEDAVKRESLRDFKRLHFASHSVIDEVSPSRSAVMLTLDNDAQEDGVLEVGEISKLDIDCDLVVLSACQTGRGKLFSGEGIVGLSRSFLSAGARAVAVSLWNVSDITTSRFMKSFYQHLVSGSGNAVALRLAKLQIMEDAKELKHPHYWAPFVLIGKP